MPFKSKAQRRKFYSMYEKGEIDKETLEKWEKETKDKNLPERVKNEKKAFWRGFQKKAFNAGGGKGFSSVGASSNANPIGELEYPEREGTQESHGRTEDDTRTEKELLDRERNPKSHHPHDLGPEFEADSIPIKY